MLTDIGCGILLLFTEVTSVLLLMVSLAVHGFGLGGIGLAIVKKCAQEGNRVYIVARDVERAQEIANMLGSVKCVYNDAALTLSAFSFPVKYHLVVPVLYLRYPASIFRDEKFGGSNVVEIRKQI